MCVSIFTTNVACIGGCKPSSVSWVSSLTLLLIDALIPSCSYLHPAHTPCIPQWDQTIHRALCSTEIKDLWEIPTRVYSKAGSSQINGLKRTGQQFLPVAARPGTSSNMKDNGGFAPSDENCLHDRWSCKKQHI